MLTPDLRQALTEHKAEILILLSHRHPEDALELLGQWEILGQPEIPLSPGVSISNLGEWFCSAYLSEHLPAVRHFLWESLPVGEVPQLSPTVTQLLDQLVDDMIDGG